MATAPHVNHDLGQADKFGPQEEEQGGHTHEGDGQAKHTMHQVAQRHGGGCAGEYQQRDDGKSQLHLITFSGQLA